MPKKETPPPLSSLRGDFEDSLQRYMLAASKLAAAAMTEEFEDA